MPALEASIGALPGWPIPCLNVVDLEDTAKMLGYRTRAEIEKLNQPDALSPDTATNYEPRHTDWANRKEMAQKQAKWALGRSACSGLIAHLAGSRSSWFSFAVRDCSTACSTLDPVASDFGTLVRPES